MKINTVPLLVSIGISLLLAYGIHVLAGIDNNNIQTGGGAISLFATLSFLISIQFQNDRTTTNVRTVSTIFFLIFLISHLLFALMTFSMPIYIISEGLLVMIYVLILYAIIKADS